MLTFDEARARLLASVRPLGRERVPTTSALGRVLAEPVYALHDVPSVDYSAMDGWAVRVADLVGEPPFRLPVAPSGESRTGLVPAPHAPGSATRIFTGAELPAGADAVIMQEEATREGEHVMLAQRAPLHGFVRLRGEDLVAGQIALPAGTRLGPLQIALAATVEAAHVIVSRRPVVAIVTTGDELRALGEPPRPASIVDAVGPALEAFVTSLGGLPRAVPTAKDDPAATDAALLEAFAASDVVITVGGVSVGDHDVVKASLARIGATLDFWRVAIKPGKPLAVGGRNGVPFLGLPGNPTSALLTFLLFGAPLLRALAGESRPLPRFVRARISRDLRRSPGRQEFVRGRFGLTEEGHVAIDPLPNQASGAATSLAWADGLIVIAADVTAIDEGDEVDVLRLADV